MLKPSPGLAGADWAKAAIATKKQIRSIEHKRMTDLIWMNWRF
jgi:hypothetical protein